MCALVFFTRAPTDTVAPVSTRSGYVTLSIAALNESSGSWALSDEVARNLKQQQAVRAHTRDELADPLCRELRTHVLEHDLAEHKVEVVRGNGVEVALLVQLVAARLGVLVELPSLLDHRGGNVDAEHGVEPLGQGLRHPADPAAVVERGLGPQVPVVLAREVEHHVDLVATRSEEVVELVGAATHVGEDRPLRVRFPERVPRVAQPSHEGHGGV